MTLRSDRTIFLTLGAGIAVPFLYFGAQLAAAPFYPGYSFLTRDASTLGSDGSTMPWILNSGAALCGVAMILTSLGYLGALRRLEGSRVAAWLTALALVGGGIGSVNAGLHPLPDPRHASGPAASVGAGLFFLPVLLPWAMWKLREGRNMRTYLGCNLAVMLALLPVMSGFLQRSAMVAGVAIPLLQTLLNSYHGLLQRIAAAIVFVPIGVCAVFLARRVRRGV